MLTADTTIDSRWPRSAKSSRSMTQARALIVRAPNVFVARGITVRVREIDAVYFEVRGDIVLDGTLESPGGLFSLKSEEGDIRATQINVSGGSGMSAASTAPPVRRRNRRRWRKRRIRWRLRIRGRRRSSFGSTRRLRERVCQYRFPGRTDSWRE